MLQDVLNLLRKTKILRNGIYNLTKENLTVKNVAEICKKINPKLELLNG